MLAGGAASVLLAATALSPLTSPLLPARLAWLQSGPAPSGTMWQWAQPTADSLRLAVSLGDRRERYVVYNVSPPDDRLTNFWLAPYDAVGDREFFRFSVLTANSLPDICTLLATQPDRIVVTADPTAPTSSPPVRPHRREDPPARLGRDEADGLGGPGDPVEQHLRRTDLVPGVEHDRDAVHVHDPEVHHDAGGDGQP